MRKIVTLMWFLWPLLLLGAALLSLWQTGLSLRIGPGSQTTPEVVRFPTAQKIGRYSYFWYEVSALSQVHLLDNPTKAEAHELLKRNNCRAGINGGFYGENFLPLGLVIIDNETLSSEHKSLLLNGYLALSQKNIPSISREKPDRDSRLALQAGPMLIEDSQPLELTLFKDEQARRSIALQLQANQLGFLTIFDAQSVYLGPKLSELPSLLAEIAKENNWEIESALNLDGGSTSFFKNDKVFLSEFRPARTLFCVTN